jgi:hypothetical protein
MGKEDITRVTTESILMEELGAEGSSSIHTTSDNGDKKDVGKEEEAPPASLMNFFVGTRILN